MEVSGGLVVALDVDVAGTWVRRLRGWIGRRQVADEAALWLPGTRTIHTAGLRTPIDVVFLDRTGTVLAVRRRLAPWRVASGPSGTAAVVELAPGRSARVRLCAGQRLALRPVGAWRRDTDG